MSGGKTDQDLSDEGEVLVVDSDEGGDEPPGSGTETTETDDEGSEEGDLSDEGGGDVTGGEEEGGEGNDEHAEEELEKKLKEMAAEWIILREERRIIEEMKRNEEIRWEKLLQEEEDRAGTDGDDESEEDDVKKEKKQSTPGLVHAKEGKSIQRKPPEKEKAFQASEAKAQIAALKDALQTAREIIKESTSENEVLNEKNWILKRLLVIVETEDRIISDLDILERANSDSGVDSDTDEDPAADEEKEENRIEIQKAEEVVPIQEAVEAPAVEKVAEVENFELADASPVASIEEEIEQVPEQSGDPLNTSEEWIEKEKPTESQKYEAQKAAVELAFLLASENEIQDDDTETFETTTGWFEGVFKETFGETTNAPGINDKNIAADKTEPTDTLSRKNPNIVPEAVDNVLELEKVHEPGFPLTWPLWTQQASSVSTGWSYILCWAGICLTLLASLATSASVISLRRNWEENTMKLKMSSIFAGHAHYPGDMSQSSTPLPEYMGYMATSRENMTEDITDHVVEIDTNTGFLKDHIRFNRPKIKNHLFRTGIYFQLCATKSSSLLFSSELVSALLFVVTTFSISVVVLIFSFIIVFD